MSVKVFYVFIVSDIDENVTPAWREHLNQIDIDVSRPTTNQVIAVAVIDRIERYADAIKRQKDRGQPLIGPICHHISTIFALPHPFTPPRTFMGRLLDSQKIRRLLNGTYNLDAVCRLWSKTLFSKNAIIYAVAVPYKLAMAYKEKRCNILNNHTSFYGDAVPIGNSAYSCKHCVCDTDVVKSHCWCLLLNTQRYLRSLHARKCPGDPVYRRAYDAREEKRSTPYLKRFVTDIINAGYDPRNDPRTRFVLQCLLHSDTTLSVPTFTLTIHSLLVWLQALCTVETCVSTEILDKLFVDLMAEESRMRIMRCRVKLDGQEIETRDLPITCTTRQKQVDRWLSADIVEKFSVLLMRRNERHREFRVLNSARKVFIIAPSFCTTLTFKPLKSANNNGGRRHSDRIEYQQFDKKLAANGNFTREDAMESSVTLQNIETVVRYRYKNACQFIGISKCLAEQCAGVESIFDLDRFIIPINGKRCDHWSGLCVDFRESKILYYDSTEHPNRTKNAKMWILMIRTFLDLHYQHGNQPSNKSPDFKNWDVDIVNAPLQKNNHDCGVYLITWMDFCVDGMEQYFTDLNSQRLWQQILAAVKDGNVFDDVLCPTDAQNDKNLPE